MNSAHDWSNHKMIITEQRWWDTAPLTQPLVHTSQPHKIHSLRVYTSWLADSVCAHARLSESALWWKLSPLELFNNVSVQLRQPFIT